MASSSSSTSTTAMNNNNNNNKNDTPFSYSPKKLVESFEELKFAESVIWKDYYTNPRLAEVRAEWKKKHDCDGSSSSSSSFVVAAVQLTGSGLKDSCVLHYWRRSCDAVRHACVEHGARLVLLPELFVGPYFCQSQEACLQNLALEIDEKNFIIRQMKDMAMRYNVVLPISLFERYNNVLYNTVVMIDADGTIVGKYRKSHIPDGTGYQEKFYFSPGDTGFQVFDTKVGKIGIGICWDQWFPECARAMALMGADILLYPTAIGSEPQDLSIDSSDHWQRVMQGHAAANMVPVVASNRYGTEILLHDDDDDDDRETTDDAARQQPPKKKREKQRIVFYGKTFITDNTGEKVAEVSPQMMNNDGIGIITSTIDPDTNRKTRLEWGLFRDRRPELYNVLLTKDGTTTSK